MTRALLISLLAACALAAAIALSGEECGQYTPGTDSAIQCETGDEIDLSIQDEADEAISQGRE